MTCGPRGVRPLQRPDVHPGLELRAVRLEAARSRGVPPYVIFHDATLREMARLRPMSITALLAVKGVGARKADDLGELFLAVIRAHTST